MKVFPVLLGRVPPVFLGRQVLSRGQVLACAQMVLLLFAFLLLSGCAASGPEAGMARADSSKASSSETASNEEMVDTGYTKQRRGDLTGAIGEVPVEELQRSRSVSHLSELLQGSVAGVHVSRGPGGGIRVRIRGISSIYGSNDPLYVVDGTPVQADPGGALSWINPHDVASISVLKGPAAAMYGSRGANGVIVVRTKR